MKVTKFCLSWLVLALAACGSGDGGPDGNPPGFNPPPPANRAPTASAGTDASGTTGQSITLAGAGTDPDGDALTYQWTITSGPAGGATLTNANSAGAQFLATQPGAYVIQLTTKDPSNASATASITLTITAPPNAVASVTLDRPYVFFSAIGQSATITATLQDANGAPVIGTPTWTSSAPNQVNVDSNGHVVATAIGSAQIIAHVNGVSSAPALIVVAEPKAGALLVTDAQVESVGPALNLGAGEAPGVGTQYEVRLLGVAAPAPGTVVLAAETSPVAGRVVATRAEGGTVIATLEIAPLYDLLARYHIDWNIDLSAYPLELAAAPATAVQKGRAVMRAGNRRIQDEGPRKLENFWCEGDVEGKLASINIDVSATTGLSLTLQDYRDDPALPPNYSKHSLEGSVAFNGSASVVFKPSISLSGACYAEAHFKIPVLGWASLIVMPQVSLGVGIDLSGELVVASAELGGTLDLDLKPIVGWECGGAQLTCRGLDDITLDTKFKPKQEFEVLNAMHVELSGHLFAFARLDAVVLGGLAGYVSILEGRMGPKQSLNLAFEDTQAKNSGMASDYDLKIDGGVKPGDAIKKAIQKLIDDDAINVSFSLKQPIPISESPKGTLRVDKTRVALGDKVTFNVDITPATKDYLGLGNNFGKGYNIDSIELWRKREDEDEFTFFKTVPAIASGDSTAFMYQWTPEGTDAGKHKFAAFVNTKFPVPHLEIEQDSVKDVEVSCFTPRTGATRALAKLALGSSNVCADEWIGTSTHLIDHGESMTTGTLTWRRDPTFDGPSTMVRYTAEGTFEWHHLIFEEAGCTVSPTQFTIGPPSEADDNALYVDYAFTPAKFSGNGLHATTLTISCPGDEPFSTPASLSWFGGVGEVSDDGLTIKGSTSVPGGSSSYLFQRP